MRTKSITLFYTITKQSILPPSLDAVKRKDEWIKDIQKEVQADYKPAMVRVTYKIHNPEIEQQRKFFEGPVVEYWLIQATDRFEGRQKRRTSTTDLSDVQEWNDFLQELKETEFEPNGYEFPESEKFWKLTESIGYEKAKDAVIDQLQKRLIQKNKSPEA